MRRVGWLVGAIAVLGLGMTAWGDDSRSGTPTTAAAGSTAPTTALPATSEPSTSTTAPAETETLFYPKEGRIFAALPGGRPVARTEGPRDAQPAPPPDGDHLAFNRLEKDGDTAGELWIANADGSDA